MGVRQIDKSHPAHDEDQWGNNAAVTCPSCGKVFLVSALLKEKGEKKGRRRCPKCKNSVAIFDNDGARVEWPVK
jgi:transcription elongation factor Elf1